MSTDNKDTKVGVEVPKKTLRQRLFYDDPNDDIELQPHMKQRLTKKHEMWAFFLLAFGYFGWSDAVGSIFQPLLTQQLARSVATLKSDPSVPCPGSDATLPKGESCVTPFGWIHVNPTTNSLLINVVTVWCVIFVSFGTSSLADHGRSSKKFTIVFTIMIGIITAFAPIGAWKKEYWVVTSVLIVVGKVLYKIACATNLCLLIIILIILIRQHFLRCGNEFL
jgi:hypothetical protein